jgi:hypothetical protein
MAGQVLGSPSYMSPEQAQGEPVDARTDVFALGAVLYELLSGQKAFPGTDVPGILLRVVREDPTPVTHLVPGLPPSVDGLIACALAKKVDARYPTAKAMAEDIADVLSGRPPRFASQRAPSIGNAPAGEETVPSGTARATPWLPAGKRATIVVLDGPRRGHVFPIESPRVILGRAGGASGAALELDDPEASRAHAVLELHETRVMLRDLGSRNGTFMGPARIIEAELPQDAEFRIGRTHLRLTVADK